MITRVSVASGAVRWSWHLAAWRPAGSSRRGHLLSAAEGGRRTEVRTGYRPQFFIRTADVIGVMDLGQAGVARPGDRVTVTVELGQPVVLGPGLGFAIREEAGRPGPGR